MNIHRMTKAIPPLLSLHCISDPGEFSISLLMRQLTLSSFNKDHITCLKIPEWGMPLPGLKF
jgi:hypothetical protein